MTTLRDRASADTTVRCRRCALQFSSLTLVLNAGLGLLKIVIGAMAGSRALVASALYSVNDVLSGIVVMISLRLARRPPDADHPYGHGKVEFVAIGIVSTILVGAVIYVLSHSVAAIVSGIETPPHLIVLPVAALSLATNQFLASRGRCVAKHTESPVIETAAEHNHADAVSSMATMIGVTGAALGLHVLDPIVAIFEAVHIIWLAGSLFGHSLRGLMDVSLPSTAVSVISTACEGVPGVLGVSRLRTRQVGAYAWVDAEVRLSHDTLIDDADEICREVQYAIRSSVPFEVMSQVKFQVRDDDGDGDRPRRKGRRHGA